MLKLAGNIQVRADFSCTGETFVVAARAVYHRDFFNLLVFVADRENRVVAQKFFVFRVGERSACLDIIDFQVVKKAYAFRLVVNRQSNAFGLRAVP